MTLPSHGKCREFKSLRAHFFFRSPEWRDSQRKTGLKEMPAKAGSWEELRYSDVGISYSKES
jgi:hypothetical protein